MAGGPRDMSTWAGLEKQPASTKDAITASLQRLKDAGKESVTILLLGKSGVGKSSTINTLIGDRLRPTNAFQAETMQPAEVRQWWQGLEICLVDTPGLVEAGDVNPTAMASILQFLVGRTVDVLVYVDRLDAYTTDLTDQLLVRGITKALGKEVWKSGVVVLTRGTMSPSDGRTYDQYVAAKQQALRDLMRTHAKLGSMEVPVVRVENAQARCRTNEQGDKVLGDGFVFLVSLWDAVVDAALSGAKKVAVTQRTVEGPDPNQRWKVLIPLVLVAQVFLVFLPLEKLVQQDKKDERRNRPKWEVEAEEHRRLNASQMARKS